MKKLLSKTLIFVNIVSAGICGSPSSLAMDGNRYLNKRTQPDNGILEGLPPYNDSSVDKPSWFDESFDSNFVGIGSDFVDEGVFMQSDICENSEYLRNGGISDCSIDKCSRSLVKDESIDISEQRVNNQYDLYIRNLYNLLIKYVVLKLKKINSKMDVEKQFETLVESIDADIQNDLKNLHGQKITIDKLGRKNINSPILLVSKLFKNYSISNTTYYGPVIKICDLNQKNNAFRASSYVYFVPRASLVMLAFKVFTARLRKSFSILPQINYQYLDGLANKLGFKSWENMSKGCFSKDKNKQFPLFYSEADLKNILWDF